MKLWGIDLGGTKIEGVVLDTSDYHNPVCRIRIPTEANKGYSHILRQIGHLVTLMEEKTGQLPGLIGIGTPGTLDPFTRKLKNSNTVCLNGQPFKDDIENLLKVSVKLANDANCFALAEATMGAAARLAPNAEVVFGIIMGTGVGGGLVVNKKMISGAQGIAGEWGHNFLDDSGGPCYCGKIGCVETVISGPALQRYYHKLSGQALTLPAIMEKHEKTMDIHATLTAQRLVHYFGKAISVVINLVDPDVVVLGGGLGNISLLYTEGVEEVKKHVFNTRLDTYFLKPDLGDSAGVFGAALLTE
jgi:fructokinase